MKTFLLLLSLLALPPVLQAGSCCASRPAPEAAAAADLSTNSLYQLDARFVTDAGEAFALEQLRGRPVVISMFFASCHYACPLLVADLTRIRDALPEDIKAETAIVLVTFDLQRDTPEALRRFRTERLLGESWILLTTDDAGVRELAALLGIKYKQEADGQFSHSNLLTVLNREGEQVHQRAGLTGGLLETAAAVVASARVGE